MWEFNQPGAVVFHHIGPGGGFFLLLLGCATFLAALALLRGRLWAWWFAVVLFAVDAIGDVVSYFLTHDPLRTLGGAVISSIFLLSLCRPQVRAYFIHRALR